MKIVRANNRAARRKRACMAALADAVGKRKPFVYLEYSSGYDTAAFHKATKQWQNDYYAYLLHGISSCPSVPRAYDYLLPKAKRPFPSYAKAAAHLTALKLNICEDNGEYKGREPLRLVQGYTTVSGKEVIEETRNLTNECDSLERKVPIRRQSSQQRGHSFHVPQTVGNIKQRKQLFREQRKAAVRISGTFAGGISTTTMDTGSYVDSIISDLIDGSVVDLL